MNSADLAFTPALEQARLIRTGEISPLELVELYLQRIQQFNDRLGSYVYVAAESAIADAKAKTEAIPTSGEDLPPFFGVPISIKDLNAVEGMPCTYGLRALKNRIADNDDGIVTRIKQAGFIILGKTAASEVGTLPYTEQPGFPPARNPWNLDHTAGGSSGGAAAALAAGLCSISQGSDGGGSIRGPAFCCGVVGIKPSRGRVSHAPFGERLNGIATNGPLGRTVGDTAALLDVLAGYIPGDPYWLPDPEPSFRQAIEHPLPPLKIAVATALAPVGEADPLCKQAVLDTAKKLEAMGHHLEPIELDFADLIEPFCIVFQAILGEAKIPWFVLNKMNRWWARKARACSCGEYLRAVTKLQMVSRRIVTSLLGFDALLLPTYQRPAIRIGEWANLRPAKTLEKMIEWVAPCPPFNATGQPAVSIPTGFAPNGLPIGVQIVGRPGMDARVLAIAAQLEDKNLWQQRPALAV